MKPENHSPEPFRQRFWQNWCDILFIHWEIDPAAIAAVLPPKLEPDLYQGKAWVGLVPFRMSGIRPVGLPALPYLSHTLETNLRTYVRHKDQAQNTADRAVWFFSLEAANPFAVVAARLGYGLKYHRANMWLNQHHHADGKTIFAAGSIRRWPDPAPVSSFVQAEIPPGPYQEAKADTLEHFLVERYALFSQHRQRIRKALVRHEPYKIKPATLIDCNPQLIAAAGLPIPRNVIENAIVHRAMDVRVRVG
ncbi:MAG: YqjF family protein [bacterium]